MTLSADLWEYIALAPIVASTGNIYINVYPSDLVEFNKLQWYMHLSKEPNINSWISEISYWRILNKNSGFDKSVCWMTGHNNTIVFQLHAAKARPWVNDDRQWTLLMSSWCTNMVCFYWKLKINSNESWAVGQAGQHHHLPNRRHTTSWIHHPLGGGECVWNVKLSFVFLVIT